MENRYFPIFVPSAGRRVVIFGGGKIAERRVNTLMHFDFEVIVVSGSSTEQIESLAAEEKLTWIKDHYDEKYLDGCFLAIACTNHREVNHAVGIAAKKRGVPVSVCDNRQECTFYFPAVAVNEEITAGIAGSGENHHITRKAAAAVRKTIEGKAY